jgi:hypothetical protein
MAYIPFGMSPAGPIGPTPPVINDKTPARSLVQLVAHVSTPTLTAIGANAIFTTAPDRGRFFPTAIWFNPSVNTGASSTPIIRIGYTNSGTVYSDFVASFTFASSLVAGQFFEIPLKADATGAPPTGRFSAPASTSIVCYVATAGAAPCAGQLIVTGFYL